MKNNEKKFKLINLFIFVIVISLFISSCKITDNVGFPEISEPNDIEPTQGVPVDEMELIPSGTLDVALPLTKESMDYIIKLYAGKASGLFTEFNTNQNGLDIPLNNLIEYEVGLNSNIVDVPILGFSGDEIIEMTNSGNLPDIYLIRDTSVFLDDNNTAPSSFKGDYFNKYVTPKNVYPQLFSNNIHDLEIYFIPYYARIKMLYINSNLFGSDVIDPIHYNYPITFSSIQSITSDISNHQSDIFAWSDFKSLSAFLPGTFFSFPENFLYSKNTINFEHPAYVNSMQMLKELSIDVKNVENLEPNQKQLIFGDKDPIMENKVFFWIDYSDRLSYYNENNLTNLYRFPLPVIEKMNIPVSTVNIAVNSNSNLEDIAKKLSIFLSYDVDALLLQSRFLYHEGFVPIVSNKTVWEQLVLNQSSGRDLYLLRESFNFSHLIHPSQENIISTVYKTLYDNYVYNMIYEDISIQETVELMDQEIMELFGND